MPHIILSDRHDTQQIIKEEKEKWVLKLLLLLGVSEEDLLDQNPTILDKYSIEVWDHIHIGDVEIIQNGTLVGKWYAPVLTPKYDEDNKIYYEISFDYDSILDNEIYMAGDDD